MVTVRGSNVFAMVAMEDAVASQKLRARTKMERFFSQNGTSVADRGTPRPLIVLSKWNNGRTKLERPSLKTELASFSL